MKNNQWKITFLAGLLTVLAFINLSWFSLTLFPGQFTPFNHQFSDLGINLLNPRGAIYYQLALILSGIGMFFFFFGLKCWYEESRNFSVIVGSLVVISLIAQGFNVMKADYYILCFAMLTVGAALLKHPKMPKWISVFSMASGFIYLISMIYHPIWLSWLITLSWLLFVTFISFRTKKAFGY